MRKHGDKRLFKRTASALSCFALLTALIFTGCGDEPAVQSAEGSSPQQSGTTLNIAVQPSAAFMPIFVARANGWIEEALADRGIAVKWFDFESGPPINEFFASGEGDIGVAGDVPVVTALAQGQDNRLIASISASASYCIVVPVDSDISSAADLKGKKVGTVINSTSHNVLDKYLATAGLSLSDIELVSITGGDAPLAFADGTCDAISIWEPTGTSMEFTGMAKIIADGTDIGYPGVNLIFCSDTILGEDPATVKVVLEQFVRGAEALQEDPKAATEQISDYFVQDPEVLKAIIDKYNDKMVFSEDDIESLQDTVSFQLSVGNISKEIDVRDYIDDSLSREIME